MNRYPICRVALVLLMSTLASRATDVRQFVVAKAQNFVQSDAGAPTAATGVDDNSPFQFHSNVDAATSTSVQSVTVRVSPSGALQTLPQKEPGNFELNTGFATKTDLDTAFPSGGYLFSIVTQSQGTKTPTLTLPADAYPNTPHLSNWSAAQSIDTTSDFTFTWEAFAGGTTNDIVEFKIEQENDSIKPDLNGTATSWTLPSNSLTAGVTYNCELRFIKLGINTTTYPGATGITGFFKNTTFQIGSAFNNPAGLLQFSSASYNVNENGGSLDISVQRLGGSTGTVSASFSMGDFTEHPPTAGVDYVSTNLTLTFAEGVTNQIVTVQILDDELMEGLEIISLGLNDPQGGATIGRSHADLNILDDELPSGPDVRLYLVAKGQGFKQSSTAVPVLEASTNSPFMFMAFVQELFSGSVTNGSLHVPSGSTLPLETHDEQLRVQQKYSTKTALDTAFGAGVYTFRMYTSNDGAKTNALTLTADNYPSTPHVSNWSSAQSVDPSAGLLLTWDAFTGGTTNDYIQLSIDDSTNDHTIFETPEFAEPTHLVGTATSVQIPGGVLSGNQTYQARLLFAKRVDSNTNYAGVPGVAVYFRETQFALQTINQPPVQGMIQFSAATYTVSEGGGSLNFVVTRTGGSSGTVTVELASADGTATANADYTPVLSTLTFLDGETSKTNSLAVLEDVIVEGSQTVLLTLRNATGGAILGTSNATVTITDNESSTAGALQFSTATYSVNESVASATITVTRSGGSAGSVTVNYAASNGTATGADYTPVLGTLTFPAGALSKTFTVPIINDVIHETNETVNLTLSNPGGGAGLGSRYTAVLTIVDNDPLSTFNFSLTNYNIAESGKTVLVTVARTGGTSAVGVNFTTTNGTATAGVDYLATNGTLAFASGVLSKTFSVPILDDTTAEGNETVLLSLSNPTGLGTLGLRSNAMVTILDNEFGGTLSFLATNFNVSETNALATITVARSNGLANGVTIHYATTAGSATEGSDYTNVSGTLTFKTNETKKTFTIPITDDSAPEGNESVNLLLSEPTGGGSLGKLSNSVLTIVDSEATLQFSKTNSSAKENGLTAAITVQRTGTGAGIVSVGYATSNGSATAGSDYTAKSGTLTFAAGVMSQTFTISLLNDTLAEGNETVNLTLTNVVGITLGQQSNAVLTLEDDDKGGVLNFSPALYTVSETGKLATITVLRTNGLASGVSVDYGTSGGNATPGADYTATNGTFNFAVNETKKTLSVKVLDDALLEGPESVSLSFSNPQGGATLGTNSTATLTITDNETGIILRFSTNSFRASETNGSATITVLRSGGLANSVSVHYSTSNGTATNGLDYSGASGTLLFGPNVTSNTFNVSIISDVVQENNETVQLQLSNPSGTAILGTLSNATLIIVEPKPKIALSTSHVRLTQYCTATEVTVYNVGEPGSVLFFGIDQDVNSDSLMVSPQFGTLQWNQSMTLTVTNIFPDFPGTYLASIHDPRAAPTNAVLSVEIATETGADFLGTWSGTWSGSSYGRNNPMQPEPTAPVSGTWILNLQTVDLANQTASGTLTWNGSDAYWTYTSDGSGFYSSPTPHAFVPNRTILFNSSNTTFTTPQGNVCGRFDLNIQGFFNAPNPSDAFYGPNFSVALNIRTGQVESTGASWSAHP
ncbi:MAG: hypothetical protein JWM68_3565, partial [Verrucomicrobiales bacterium]|nr:hypothetical protein [Verrucomicrobiales bacterium]